MKQPELGFEENGSYLVMWEDVDVTEADKSKGDHRKSLSPSTPKKTLIWNTAYLSKGCSILLQFILKARPNAVFVRVKAT